LTKVSIDTIIEMTRPSYKEINQRIKQAQKAVTGHRISLINPISIVADALELGFPVESIGNTLTDIFGEITPKSYVGQYPPQKSYEDKIAGSELYSFRWVSRHLGCRIYLKFALKENHFWLVSLHEDRA
jgi:hypothetical protein